MQMSANKIDSRTVERKSSFLGAGHYSKLSSKNSSNHSSGNTVPDIVEVLNNKFGENFIKFFRSF